jgi:acetyl-CoA C-acetyltransferase
LAKIVGHTSDAHEPQWFTTAPVTAMERLMQEIHWTRDQVDLFEINEAFAVVTLAAIHDLKLDPEKVNIHGGACALGHPLGASGTRIVCTLLSALKHHNLNRGIASLCVGGGEATAIAIDRLI